MAIPRRKLFRRTSKPEDFVVVRYIRLGGGRQVPPGAPLPAGRMFQRRRWYRRRMIGYRGDPWTEWMLKRWAILHRQKLPDGSGGGAGSDAQASTPPPGGAGAPDETVRAGAALLRRLREQVGALATPTGG